MLEIDECFRAGRKDFFIDKSKVILSGHMGWISAPTGTEVWLSVPEAPVLFFSSG